MSTKFLHTADWQLGKPYASIFSPHKRTLLRQERVLAIGRLAALATQHGAQFLLVAGDLFDSVTPHKETVSAACSAIGALGVPVLVIPGNHDHGGPGSIWGQEFFLREQQLLAPNLRVLLTPEPVELEGAVILPCPLMRRAEANDPMTWLRPTHVWEGLSPSKPRIVLAHGSTQGFSSRLDEDAMESGGGASNLLDLSKLPGAELDYVALGDWHGTKQVGTKAWYSGTPEADRFTKGSDHNPGKVLLVEVSRGAEPKVAVTPSARIQWHELSQDFADDSGLDQLEATLQGALGQRADQDLLWLHLQGSLGIEATSRLEKMLESYDSRLLRLKLDNRTQIAPTQEELGELTQNLEHPLIASVARRLVEKTQDSDMAAANIARAALRQLHSACQTQVVSS